MIFRFFMTLFPSRHVVDVNEFCIGCGLFVLMKGRICNKEASIVKKKKQKNFFYVFRPSGKSLILFLCKNLVAFFLVQYVLFVEIWLLEKKIANENLFPRKFLERNKRNTVSSKIFILMVWKITHPQLWGFSWKTLW